MSIDIFCFNKINNSNKILNQSSSTIDTINIELNEIELNAIDIAKELEKQNKQLKEVRSRMRKVSEEVENGSSIVSRMMRPCTIQ